MVSGKEKPDGLKINHAFSIRRLLIDLFFVIFLPNIFLSVVAELTSLSRPLINFDYVVVTLVFLLGWRVTGVFVLVLAFFFDILFLLGQVVPIIRISDVFYLLGFLGVAPLAYKLLLALSVVVFLIKAFGYLQFSRRDIQISTVLVVNFLVFSYVATLFLSDNSSDNRIWRVRDVPLISSLTVSNFDFRQAGFVANFKVDPQPFTQAPYAGKTRNWLDNPQTVPDRALLIVSESWGVTNEAILKDILNPLTEVGVQRGSFKTGDLRFSGLTIEAELRELCGLTTSHFNLSGVKSGFQECLPNILKKEGYRTIGIHGAAGLMYDRALWYPKAGFQDVVFFESHNWDRRCYSFPGACDLDIVSRLDDFFSDQSKVFLYWLTLNSHAFYDERDIVNDVFDCRKHNIAEVLQTCRNLKLHAQFFHGLAEELKNPAFDDVSVLIVGDHQPPITDKEEKLKYFAEDRVPWVSFKVDANDDQD